MKATITYPVRPAATVNVSMTEREATLLCHLSGRLTGEAASNLINGKDGLTTTGYEMSQMLSGLFHSMRKMEVV